MKFDYTFGEGGAHQIVVMLLCMSDGGSVMPMRKDFRHYIVNNLEPSENARRNFKCLNIHEYLKGSNFQCTHFQVQFIGAAAGSYLAIDSVYFYRVCRKYISKL